MTPRKAKPWHDDCKRLRAEGFDPPAIARKLRKDVGMVRWVLDENNERQQARQRARQSRSGEVVLHDPSRKRSGEPVAAPRKVKAPVSAEDRQKSLSAFLAGHIGPGELARRLVP